MRRSLQTETGQRLKENRKKFRLYPINNTTKKRSDELHKARSKRIRKKHARGSFLAKNPFMGL